MLMIKTARLGKNELAVFAAVKLLVIFFLGELAMRACASSEKGEGE